MRSGPLPTLGPATLLTPYTPRGLEGGDEVRRLPSHSCRCTRAAPSPSPSPGVPLTLPRGARRRLQAPLKLQLQLHVLLHQLVHLMPQRGQLLGVGQAQTRPPPKAQALCVGERTAKGEGVPGVTREPWGTIGVTLATHPVSLAQPGPQKQVLALGLVQPSTAPLCGLQLLLQQRPRSLQGPRECPLLLGEGRTQASGSCPPSPA